MSTSSSLRDGASVRRIATGEDGAVAVVVAISLIMFFGFAALAIDLGSAWSTKRDLNTDLDAAALAGARTLADEVRVDPSRCAPGTTGSPSLTSDVRASVRGLLAAIGGRADVADRDITINCDRRTVTVLGSQEAATVFAGLLGVNEINPTGYAVAKAVEGAGGRVLPITFCSSIDPIADWVEAGAMPGVQRRITYGEGPRDECGFTAGAWGWFGSNSVSTLRQWLATGYPGLVQLPPDRQCTGPAQTADGWCNGGAGAQPNLLDQPSQQNLHGLRCPGNLGWEDCTLYTFVIHGNIRDGQGTNVDYAQVAFLDAVVRGAQRAGNTANSWIDLEFVAYRTSPGEIAQSANSSFMCSADGAPAGDPNCD